MLNEQIFKIINERRRAALGKAGDNLEYARRDSEFLSRDTDVRRLVIETARLNSQNKDITAIKKQLRDATSLRTERLLALGLTLRDLEPQYYCKKCRDTGFTGDSLCACARLLINTALAESSGMKNMLKAKFSDFDPLIYPEGRQRNEIIKLYDKMKDYCAKFPDTRYCNIMFIGATGLGKTQLISSVANELIRNCENVLYLTAFALNNLMLKAHTTFDGRERALDDLLETSLLIIDDLGTEPVLKNVTEDYLLTILNERTLRGRHTLISTNLPLDALNLRYGTRLVSRLTDKSHSLICTLTGEDVRLKKGRA